MKHKHAELMMQYAQDAMETNKPWELWEMKYPTEKDWLTLDCHPLWQGALEYRRKPKMISVTLMSGEVVIFPEPHKFIPQYGQNYYLVDSNGEIENNKYDGMQTEVLFIRFGLVHLTKEAAEQHSYALFKINNQVAK